jgi:potassium efflux system protein
MVPMIPQSTGCWRISADKMMTPAPRAALLAGSLLFLCFASGAQAQNPSPAPTPSPSATPTAAPTAVPLPDIVAASDSASEELNEIQSELSSNKTVDYVTRELAATTKEIDARELETRRILRPGVPLEALGDFETRWQQLADQLTASSRQLTDRATALDREVTQMAATRTTWKATLEFARQSNAPSEVTQRISQVLDRIDATEEMLQKRRAAVLSLQTRVAEQTQRANSALRSIRSAQSAAVNRLWLQDSPPIWSPEVRTAAAQSLGRDSQVSLGAQAAQVRNYLEREWTKLIYVALVFIAFAFIMLRVKRQVARWTDEDRALGRTNRVLQFPFSTACLLTIVSARLILYDAPRGVWAIVGTLALIPIVVVVRRLIDRHLFPVVNALVVFYFVAQLRALAASIPVLSRIMLLLEMAGGLVFLIWFIRARRRSGPRTTSNRTARIAASIAVAGFGAIIAADSLGYVALANYLCVGILAAAYLAVALYAAARILEGLVFFALRTRPLASLGMVQRHQTLLLRRIARVIGVAAIVTWVLLSLSSFSLREAVISRTMALLNAKVELGSVHFSLGAVVAFILTIWITLLLSRLLRFFLKEEVYDRFHLARGPAYAVSTLVHYVVLLVGFYIAIAALGADMTKLAILAGAVGVGAGFGLQNIFNNFFSGLILLFERPVQVGDLIQVGDQTGVVRRIGIRASIIALDDKSQLIIPNGQLISEKVTNRTSSSLQKRIELTIRTAYGEDPERVMGLLVKTAATHPNVTQDPPPDAVLKQFGEDALVFVLGFTTEDVARFPFVQSDVAVAVNAALREAGIEIPVPQRIVHLEQNDATKHSLGQHRADAGGNLPTGADESLPDTANSNPNPGDRSQTDSS